MLTDVLIMAAAEFCCQWQYLKSGDTLASLAEQGGLPANSGPTLIKLLNGLQVDQLTKDMLDPNSKVRITVPCARLINYVVQVIVPGLAPAAAPAPSG